MQQDAISLKVLIIGDLNVGKSCLIARYLQNTFSNKKPTIGVQQILKQITLDSQKINILIHDTAGSEKFRSLVTSCFQGTNGFLLAYSIDDRKSFDNLSMWIKEIQEKCSNQNYSLMIVGNKSDLQNRAVSFEEGNELANQYKCPFFETSSKEGTNVKQVIESLAYLCYENIKNKKWKIDDSDKPLKLQNQQKIKKSRCCLLN